MKMHAPRNNSWQESRVLGNQLLHSRIPGWNILGIFVPSVNACFDSIFLEKKNSCSFLHFPSYLIHYSNLYTKLFSWCISCRNNCRLIITSHTTHPQLSRLMIGHASTSTYRIQSTDSTRVLSTLLRIH